MKRNILLVSAMICLAAACGNDAGNDENLNTEAPAALDSTTKHPNGVTSGAVISTDTSAMRVVDSTNDK